MKFANIKVGDRVVWHRSEMYGGQVHFTVIEVTSKRFKVKGWLQNWLGNTETEINQTYRIEDGRVVGNPHNIHYVEWI